MSDPILFWGSVVAGTVLGPVLLAAWIRNHELHAPEPWSSVARAFAWGGTGAVALTLAVELVFAPSQALRPVGLPSALVAAVLVAPVVEEATKALGLVWIADEHVEPEDGLVYGAAAGLGFSATENLVYGVSAWLEGGVGDLVATVAVRTFTSSLLHATATAIVGYAIWRYRARSHGAAGVVVAYLGAALLHAAFNLFASSRLYVAFLVLLAIAIGGLSWLRRRVRELDRGA